MGHGLMMLLGGRAFDQAWFWLLLAVVWSWAMRAPLGVPQDVATQAARVEAEGADDPRALLLLDWLSLVLPRWRAGRFEAAVLVAAATFVASALLALGFGFGLAGAQGLALMVVPLLGLAALRVRLAARLRLALQAAASGGTSANAAARGAARALTRHRRWTLALAVAAVAATSAWGALWTLRNPWG